MSLPSAVVCASLKLRNPNASTNRSAPPKLSATPGPLHARLDSVVKGTAPTSSAVVCAQLLKPDQRRPVSIKPAASSSASSLPQSARDKVEAARNRLLNGGTILGSSSPSQFPKLEASKPWPSPDGWRLVKSGVITDGDDATFGDSSWKLYEICNEQQMDEEPYFCTWLHGADGGGDIPPADLVKMQQRLKRRIFWLVPISPKPSSDGYQHRFFWGVKYTKSQNKNDWGFIYGELHEPYLKKLCDLIQVLSKENGCIANILSGYSMGGYGCWQLAGYRPALFTAIVPVAGYGIGTKCKGGMYCAPQPESSEIFERFLAWLAPKIKALPIVMAVHAAKDTTSPYEDTKAIIDKLKGAGCNAHLVTVGDEAAESDKGKRRVKSAHHYYGYTLINDTSEKVLYARLRVQLNFAIGGGRGLKRPSSAASTGAIQPPSKTLRLSGGKAISAAAPVGKTVRVLGPVPSAAASVGKTVRVSPIPPTAGANRTIRINSPAQARFPQVAATGSHWGAQEETWGDDWWGQDGWGGDAHAGGGSMISRLLSQFW